jgi:hypothetical protein
MFSWLALFLASVRTCRVLAALIECRAAGTSPGSDRAVDESTDVFRWQFLLQVLMDVLVDRDVEVDGMGESCDQHRFVPCPVS